MIRMYALGKFSVGRVVLRKTGIMAGALSALAVLGVMGFALTQDMSRFMPKLGDALSTQSGHRVTIEGPIKLSLAAYPGLWVTLHDVDVAPGGEAVTKAGQPYQVSLREARALVRLRPLFSRNIEIEALRIDGGLIEIDGDLSLSDAFDTMPHSRPNLRDGWQLTTVRKVIVDNSALKILKGDEQVFRVPINNASAEPGEQGLLLHADGLVEGRRVVFEGRSGPWTAFLAGHRVYLNGEVKSESATLKLVGSVADPSTHGVEFLANGEAENLNDVATLFGLSDLKRTSKVKVAAHIKASASELSVDDLALTYGRGDVGGWFKIKSGAAVTEVNGALHSDFLDLEAFEGGRFLHPPQKLFPDSPFPTRLVKRMQGEFRYRATTILLANAKLEGGEVSFVSSDGVVAINPIAVQYEDGNFEASVVLDARDRPGFKSTVNLVNFNLGKLLSAAKMTDEVTARLDFGARLRGEGETVADMFANASGQTNLVMGEGRLPSQLLAMLGGRKNLGIVATDEGPGDTDAVDLSCVVSRFDVLGGVARSRAFLMETDETVTTGRGSLDLATETFDLRVVPRPKNPAHLKDASDLRVTGRFLEPKVRVDRKKISKGIAGSLGRFALSRESNMRLLPLVELPATQSNACIVALTGRRGTQEAKKETGHRLTMVQ